MIDFLLTPQQETKQKCQIERNYSRIKQTERTKKAEKVKREQISKNCFKHMDPQKNRLQRKQPPTIFTSRWLQETPSEP